MPYVTDWSPKKTKILPHQPAHRRPWALRSGSETAEQQQESCPAAPPSTGPKMPKATYWSPKKTKILLHQPAHRRPWALRSGSETAEQQQESCPAAPPSTAPKVPNVTYWSPKKTKRFCHTSQPIAEPELWGAVPKRPNSSRNRAQQHLQAQRPKCPTSPTEALRKQRDFDTSQPIAEPELWGAVPKRPNPKCLTSPTEAQRKQRDFATPASPSQNLSSEDRFRNGRTQSA